MSSPTIVTGAVVSGMAPEEYHRHPALSSSQARTLLASPARYLYERDHPRQPTPQMILGTCVHTEVLGTGQGWTVVDGNRNTKAVKERVAEEEAKGLIVLKSEEADQVYGMAEAVHRHPEARQLLSADAGAAEQVLLWTDPDTGIACRAMLDFTLHSGRAIIDLKTTGDATKSAIARHMGNFGYPIQAAHYLVGASQLGIVQEDATFLWVFVEREPPHGVTVCRLDQADIDWAESELARAYEIFRDCSEADAWPIHTPDHIITISLPPWLRRNDMEESW